MTRGKFIVFEGGEGSGKSTFMQRLRAELSPDTIFTRYPGGTPIGEKIRQVVLSKDSQGMDIRAELLLFLAARAQLISERIAPALSEGHNVICDRFSLSTLVYQIYGRQKPEYLTMLQSVSKMVNNDCVPDATILLDVTPSIGLTRAKARPEETNRFDEEALAFHERVREGYKKHIAEHDNVFVIDSDKQLEEVWIEVQNAVQSVLATTV